MQTQKPPKSFLARVNAKKLFGAGLAYKFKELSEDLFEELSEEKSSRVCGGYRVIRDLTGNTQELTIDQVNRNDELGFPTSADLDLKVDFQDFK